MRLPCDQKNGIWAPKPLNLLTESGHILEEVVNHIGVTVQCVAHVDLTQQWPIICAEKGWSTVDETQSPILQMATPVWSFPSVLRGQLP